MKLLQDLHALLTFDTVPNPLRLPTKTTSALQKVFRTRPFFSLLTSTCASRQNGVHFSTSQLPKVLRECVWSILTWKSASRHNGLQLLISHLVRWLRTRALVSTFFRLFHFFAHLGLLSSDFLCLDLVSSSLSFSFPTRNQLCFSCVHTVRSLTFKLLLVPSCDSILLKTP